MCQTLSKCSFLQILYLDEYLYQIIFKIIFVFQRSIPHSQIARPCSQTAKKSFQKYNFQPPDLSGRLQKSLIFFFFLFFLFFFSVPLSQKSKLSACIGVRLHCSYIAVALQLHCSCIAVASQLHCSCIAVALQLHCSCIAVALQLHCSCNLSGGLD